MPSKQSYFLVGDAMILIRGALTHFCRSRIIQMTALVATVASTRTSAVSRNRVAGNAAIEPLNFLELSQYPMQVDSRQYPMQVDSRQYPVQVGSRQYPVQVGSGQYPVQVGSGHYPVQVGSGQYPMQVGSGQYPMQVGSGHYPVQVGSGHYPVPDDINQYAVNGPAQLDNGNGNYPTSVPSNPLKKIGILFGAFTGALMGGGMAGDGGLISNAGANGVSGVVYGAGYGATMAHLRMGKPLLRKSIPTYGTDTTQTYKSFFVVLVVFAMLALVGLIAAVTFATLSGIRKDAEEGKPYRNNIRHAVEESRKEAIRSAAINQFS